MSDPVEPTTDDREKAIEALDLAGIDHPFTAMNALIALGWGPAFRWHCAVEGCHLADGPMHSHVEFDADEWAEGIAFERDHARAKGYTPEHDDEHGVDHLLMWAQDYARRGRVFESAALVEAARELLLRSPAGKPVAPDRQDLADALAMIDPDAVMDGAEWRDRADALLATPGLFESRESVQADPEVLAEADVIIVWDDGHGLVIAVSSPPLPGWTVTGSRDMFESIDAIIERFPSATSWRLLNEAEPAHD